VTDEEPSRPPRRRVERGEGEVTQWPRGLVGYVPKGPADEAPDPEEDRTGNRLKFAARLIGVLRARGENVDRELGELREAETAYARHDRARATARVERLLAQLGERGFDVPPTDPGGRAGGPSR
jgi:hypothetical protein